MSLLRQYAKWTLTHNRCGIGLQTQMTFVSATQFLVCLVKLLVGAFNQENALGTFSVIMKLQIFGEVRL